MPILKASELTNGIHDAEPLYECSLCKSWFPQSAQEYHQRKRHPRPVDSLLETYLEFGI